jgi:serine phosphatase RsbU (regulator of sigma subunit)/HAMP domain-containing protein
LHSALVVAAARAQRMLDSWERDMLERGQHQMETAWLLLGELEDGLPPPVRRAVENANADYRRSYAPMLMAARSDDPGQLSAGIIAAMQRHLVFLSAVQGQISQDLDDRQTRLVRSSREAITLWSLLLLGGFLAVCLGVAVVRRKIVIPIEKLSQVMRRLAEDDLTVPIEKPGRLDEIGQMQASLRFFKVTAIRRNRLRVQRQVLHAELEAMFAQLRRDLDAAATVQAALLPADGKLGNLKFRSLFLPSSVVAGDSFDIFPLADGKVAFFQLDVAGHGASAGLGSAVAHYALSQAFSARGRPGGDRRRRYETLEGLAESVNASWPKGLPYFTLLMGELDPLDGSGTLVSAGHPAPFIVKAAGEVTQLQASGVPVGILAASAYERSHFTLAPGERMVLASDGVSEAADPSGALFSESRLKALLRDTAALPADQLLSQVKATLIAWRNKEFFDDDVSMMVIERSS